MILYEHPFNERVRTWLRLERLFIHLGTLIKRESQVDHHYALSTLFEIMEIASRSDLKTDILSELEHQKKSLMALQGYPEISETTLNRVVDQLQACTESLSLQGNHKNFNDLDNNEWLMSIRKRMSIPGGTCEFDLPSYHAWLHFPSSERLSHLYSWIAEFAPLADAISNLLCLLRDNGTLQKAIAPGGKFELTLPANKSFSLLRIMVNKSSPVFPEISANRLLTSIRWKFLNDQWKSMLTQDDIEFEFAICA